MRTGKRFKRHKNKKWLEDTEICHYTASKIVTHASARKRTFNDTIAL